MPHRIAVLAIALTTVVPLGFAACGTTGDGESEGTTTTTRATTESETTETTSSEPDDSGDAQARAEAIDVSADELPAEWDTVPHEDEGSNLVSQCSDFDVDQLAAATYYTDDFTTGDLENNDGQQFSVGTRVFEDEQTATDILDVIPTDDFIACVNQTVRDQLGGQIDGQIEAHELSTSADQTEGFSGHLVLSSGSTGETLDFWIAFAAIRTGDLVTGLSGVALGQDIDGQLFTDLADRIVELQGA